MNHAKRVYQIDLFRFVAAVAVVLYHYTSFYGISQPAGAMYPFPLLSEVFKYGYLGVDLFFIISGFVIALSIRQRSLSRFWKSRVTRLYPAYWFCLLITFTIVALYGGHRYVVTQAQLLANATMFNGFAGIEHVDGAYWSLYVEMKFYLLIVLYLIVRKVLPVKLHHLIFLWLGVAVLYPWFDFGQHFVFRIARSALILDYSHLFIAGMLFYRIYRNEGGWANYAGLAICLPLAVHHSLGDMRSLEDIYGYQLASAVVSAAVCSFFLLMYLVSTERLQTINSPRFLRFGVLTYPLYLLHQRVGYVVFDHLIAPESKYLLLLCTLAAVLAAAYGINKLVEIPLSSRIASFLDRLAPVRPSSYLK